LNPLTRFFRTLTTPSNFQGDPYGWLTNQVSHTLLGIGLAFFSHFLFFVAMGDWPYRSMIFLILLTGYVLWELVTRSKDFWDSVEDTIFTIFWGAGASMLSVQAVCTTLILADPIFTFAAFCLWGAHLVTGVIRKI